MTKKIFTAAEAILRVQEEMDTQAEVFIDESEYIIYMNDAIDEAEAEIHSMNEDYMLTSSPLDIVGGQIRGRFVTVHQPAIAGIDVVLHLAVSIHFHTPVVGIVAVTLGVKSVPILIYRLF